MCGRVLPDEGVPYPDSLAKYAAAFLKNTLDCL